MLILRQVIICLLTVVTHHDSYAGKYKRKYGHSRLTCAWMDTGIVIFGIVIKKRASEEAHGHKWK